MNDTSKATILVAEDDVTVAMIAAFNLERAGFSVEVASNGGDALNKANVKLFDLVITDEEMPLMTGQQLCRRLRDDERYAETPIIFLTAKQFELDSEHLKDELGVSAVVSKPFSPRALVDMAGLCTTSARTSA